MFASATYGTIGIYFFCKLQSNDSNLMIIITGKYGNLRFKLKVPNKLALGDKVIALQHTQAKTSERFRWSWKSQLFYKSWRSDRLDWADLRVYEFFFFLKHIFVFGSYARNLQTSFFTKTFIKNGSHSTIHTFKNYFVIMFSIFSFQQDKRYPNTPVVIVAVKANTAL